jgi:hypothetical protein
MEWPASGTPKTDIRTAHTVLRWLMLRVGVYALVMPSVVLLSNIVGVDVLRRVAFGAAAGWEVAVTLGICARISPRFRPVYEGLVQALDKWVPFDVTERGVDDAIDRDQS